MRWGRRRAEPPDPLAQLCEELAAARVLLMDPDVQAALEASREHFNDVLNDVNVITLVVQRLVRRRRNEDA